MTRIILVSLLFGIALLGQAPAPRPPARPAATTPASSRNAPSPRDLKYPPLRPVQLPAVTAATLPNGLRVLLLEDHELPLVSGTAFVHTGTVFDPREKVGLAALTGMVLRSGGVSGRTGSQLDEQLDAMGATIESNIGQTYGSVTFTAMTENFAPVLLAFHDVLTAPDFAADKIEFAKGTLRQGILTRNQDPAQLAVHEFAAVVSGKDTPYAWRPEYSSLDRITRADIQAFHRRYFFPANTVLAVRGDFDTATVKASLERLFGTWKVTQEPVSPPPPIAPPHPGGTYLALKKEGSQTWFAVGGPGSDYKDPDGAALTVMTELLAGGVRSRVAQRIRDRLDRSVEISASWGFDYLRPGLFRISGSVKSPIAVEALRYIREEIDRLRSAEITDEEFQRARESALSRAVFAVDSKAKILDRVALSEFFGYPAGLAAEQQRALAAVTRADVSRVAKQKLDPANLVSVVIGNPDDFARPLDSLGVPVTSIDLTIPPYRQEAVRADAASLEKGKQILQRLQAAVGGADKVAAIQDSTQVAEFHLAPESGGFTVKETDLWITPTHFRQESVYPNITLMAYCDGKFGWIATRQGSAPLDGPQLQQMQGDLFRWFFRLYLSDRIPGRVVNALDDITLEISEPGGQLARVTVDPQSGLPQILQYSTVPVTGAPIAVEETWTDFRDVSGIKLPFRMLITYSGRKFADVIISSYKVNSGLRVQDLQKRP
jgi:zinc protease